MQETIHYMVIDKHDPNKMLYPRESEGPMGALYLIDKPGYTEPRQEYLLHAVKDDDIIALKAERIDEDGHIFYLVDASALPVIMLEAKPIRKTPYGGHYEPVKGMIAHHRLDILDHGALETAARQQGFYLTGYLPKPPLIQPLSTSTSWLMNAIPSLKFISQSRPVPNASRTGPDY